MSEDRFVQQINEHKPFNINIEFNINGRRHRHETPINSDRIPVQGIQPKSNLCNCQAPRTPDPAQTDRNTYNKDSEYLQPMEDQRQKRKSKRNSMDMNISRSNHPDTSNKAKFKSLMQTQVFKRVEPKKKRTFSKYEGQGFKKGLWDGASKSAAIQVRSQKKGQVHNSLKSIIHKIVHNELSKRTLGTSFSKGKNPYQVPSSGGTTSRKKQKRKQIGSKSDKEIRKDEFIKQNIVVQKLNSLKSMSASIVRSDIDEPEIPYYSKKRGRIHIHTDHSIDLIDQIAFYEKKEKREDKRKEDINPLVLKDTTELIETYIQLMQMNEKAEENRENSDEVQEEEEKSVSLHSEKQKMRFIQRKNMREVLSKEMDDLFQSQGDEVIEEKDRFSNEFIQKDKEKVQVEEPFSGEKLRPFLSSQIERGGLSRQLQRIKIQQLKKQEIEKWGYLLEYIKKNMGQEADTQLVLNQVYEFLQRNKNDLQIDLAQEGTNQKQVRKEIDEEFTVKYSENHENEHHEEYYQNSSLEKKKEEVDEDVASFREEYTTEQNEDLKLLNLDTISGALKQRKSILMAKQEKQLNALQLKKHASKISEEEYEQQKKKIMKWTKKQLEEISKAKKSIWQGYREAKGILDKNIHARKYEERSSAGKMMKCLSETYLKKAGLDYTQALKVEKKEKSHESNSKEESVSSHSVSYQQQVEKEESSEQVDYKEDDMDELANSEENVNPSPISEPLGGSQELSLQKSEQMEAIKERLLKMKQEHFAGEDSSDNISYEQVQRDLDEGLSDEEMAIINKEMGSTTTAKSFNHLETKLKYCCAQDKEDIFEFIFLDLCIELYQEPCSDNKIMKLINHYVTKAQAMAKKKKGVKTNLNVVKQYLKRFSSFLLRTNKVVLQNLCTPMGPSALQMLRYMHDGDYDIGDGDDEAPTFIIPVSTFEKFQQSLLPTLQFEQYYDDPDKEQARIGFLKTILHIHNRALFDSMNEFLDHERPFGIWGAPFPWKKTGVFSHTLTDSQLEDKLKKSTDKVVEQCSYVCGLLADKQESLVGNAKISESYIEQIREDRLSRMLANELVESEERWLFYDDEQTEVLVQLSNYIWTSVVNEARIELKLLLR